MASKRTYTADKYDSNVVQFTKDGNPTIEDRKLRFLFASPENDFRVATAVVPPGSKWHPGPHWHEHYDEVMRVRKGRAKVLVGTKYLIKTPEDGEFRIPRSTIHDVMRADIDAPEDQWDPEDMWLEERGDPTDGSKDVWFRHAFSIRLDRELYGWKFPFQLNLVRQYTDNHFAIGPSFARWYCTHAYQGFMAKIALAMGLQPFYREYLPERLEGVATKLYGAELPWKKNA